MVFFSFLVSANLSRQHQIHGEPFIFDVRILHKLAGFCFSKHFQVVPCVFFNQSFFCVKSRGTGEEKSFVSGLASLFPNIAQGHDVFYSDSRNGFKMWQKDRSWCVWFWIWALHYEVWFQVCLMIMFIAKTSNSEDVYLNLFFFSWKGWIQKQTHFLFWESFFFLKVLGSHSSWKYIRGDQFLFGFWIRLCMLCR